MPSGDLSASPTSRRAALAALALSLLVLLVGLVDVLNFTVDDVFICLRYAENAAHGLGLVFNAGQRVEGYSNLLWTLMLTLLAHLGFTQQASELSLYVAAKIMGIVFAFLTLLAVVRLAYRLQPHTGAGGHARLLPLAGVFLASAYSFPLWSASGLETPLAAFLFTLGALLAIETQLESGSAPRRLRVALGSGLAYGLLALTRPEAAFVWAPATLLAIVTGRRSRRALVAGAAVTALVIGLATAWRWSYYGALIPNSFVAKAPTGFMDLLTGTKYLLSGLAGSLGVLALGVLTIPALLRTSAVWGYLVALSAAAFAFAMLSGGDWMPGFRLVVPYLSAVVLVVLAAALQLLDTVRPRTSGVAMAALLCVLAAMTFAQGRAFVRAQMPFPTAWKSLSWHSVPFTLEVAQSLRSELPAGSVLALGEAGIVPYFNPQLRILDVYGLMEPRIARMPGRHLQKLDPEYFRRAKPDYYLTLLHAGQPSYDASALLATAWFPRDYELLELRDPFRVALTRGGPATDAARQADVAFALYRRRNGAHTQPAP